MTPAAIRGLGLNSSPALPPPPRSHGKARTGPVVCEEEGLRQCSCCQRWLPTDRFKFRPAYSYFDNNLGRRVTKAAGVNPMCMECVRESTRLSNIRCALRAVGFSH
ncbi:MAG: hypothetical protein BWY85_00019 [Firmicutes bacterium ADurb.Bin506]|nr:MAG: hypothetical protein BWY85_00019 [Firmicutes bacterium ADurb.Bin506]